LEHEAIMSAAAPPDPQQQLAQERTDIAYQRTWLAEERTFSAWLRTGIASVATGLATAKLLVETGPTWLLQALGSLFIVLGAAIFCLAFVAYQKALRRLPKPRASGIPLWVVAAMSLVLLVGPAVALFLVFLDS
jgi:putative membrane protein